MSGTVVDVLVSAAADSLLQRIVRGEPAWFQATPAHGIRAKEAAHRLVGAGMARLIELGSPGGGNYVLIPPNAEWDFQRDEIRQPVAVAELIAAGIELQAAMDENEADADAGRSKFDSSGANRFLKADARHRAALAACGAAS